MDNIKDNKYYVNKIIECVDVIDDYMKGKTIEDLENDIVTNNVVLFQLINISSYSTNLSEDFKCLNKNINWGEMKGLRNVIVHDYTGIRYDIVYETVKNDLPKLKEELLKNEI